MKRNRQPFFLHCHRRSLKSQADSLPDAAEQPFPSSSKEKQKRNERKCTGGLSAKQQEKTG